jgi:putative ABC transport system substrate-binding protein
MAWPLSARAQQGRRVRRIGVLMNSTAENSEAQTYLAAFLGEMQKFGWTVGNNIQFDTRWTAGDNELGRRHAAELIALAPDLILAAAVPAIQAVRLVSDTVPIVFTQAIDPVGAGAVESLARPGGNATGFTQFEYSLSGKWPELLKEIVPGIARIGVLRDGRSLAGIGQWAIMQAAAAAMRMELTPISVIDVGEMERGVAAFAREPNSGLVVPVSAGSAMFRDPIVACAARHRLPAVYPYRSFVDHGGLVSYGPDLTSQYRRAAGYVDRILKGEKPADLPVQAPTKYDLTINLKTAKALGLTVPPSVLARANEVIE